MEDPHTGSRLRNLRTQSSYEMTASVDSTEMAAQAQSCHPCLRSSRSLLLLDNSGQERTRKNYINALPHDSVKGYLSGLGHSNTRTITQTSHSTSIQNTLHSICISLPSSFLPHSSLPPAATLGRRLQTKFGLRTTHITTLEAVSCLSPGRLPCRRRFNRAGLS